MLGLVLEIQCDAMVLGGKKGTDMVSRLLPVWGLTDRAQPRRIVDRSSPCQWRLMPIEVGLHVSHLGFPGERGLMLNRTLPGPLWVGFPVRAGVEPFVVAVSWSLVRFSRVSGG